MGKTQDLKNKLHECFYFGRNTFGSQLHFKENCESRECTSWELLLFTDVIAATQAKVIVSSLPQLPCGRTSCIYSLSPSGSFQEGSAAADCCFLVATKEKPTVRCSCPANLWQGHERVKQNRWAQLKEQWMLSSVPFVFYQQMCTKASAAALNN